MSERLQRALALLREAREIVNSEIGATDGALLRRAEQAVSLAIEAVTSAVDDEEACA